MSDKYKCPECGSEDTVKAGRQLTKIWGNRPRRKCKKCATTFYVEYNKQEDKNEQKVV